MQCFISDGYHFPPLFFFFSFVVFFSPSSANFHLDPHCYVFLFERSCSRARGGGKLIDINSCPF